MAYFRRPTRVFAAVFFRMCLRCVSTVRMLNLSLFAMDCELCSSRISKRTSFSLFVISDLNEVVVMQQNYGCKKIKSSVTLGILIAIRVIYPIRLCSKAYFIRPTIVFVLVFSMIFFRCVSTVRGLMNSFSAISAVVNSSQTNLSISSSRAVN